MPFISGVLAPIWPRLQRLSAVGISGEPSEEAGPVPVTVRSIARVSPSPDASWALSGESSLLMDALGRGFIPVRTHMGCLVADGDPVVRPGTRADWPMVRAFLDLSQAGGRIPVLREVSPAMAELYRRKGFNVRLSGTRTRVDLSPASAPSLPPRAAEDRELEAEVLSERRALALYRPLALLSPGLDVTSLHGASVVVVRSGSRVVGWARLWAGEGGGSARMDRVRSGPSLSDGALEALLAAALDWSRELGAQALVLPSDLPPSALEALGRSGAVRREPRYTASPPGWRARVSDLLLRVPPLSAFLPT
ncbi:MAG: hypothetical protein P8188_09225 [Gemmatimonadota bacterium]